MSKLTKWKYTKPSFWDDFFEDSWHKNTYNSPFMRADISKRKGHYVFDIDIPGHNKDDIKVSIDKGYLTVKTTQQHVPDEVEYLHQERFNGEYSRSFYLGCSDDTKANATYHNGVLTVVIQLENQQNQEETKYITIN